MEENIKISNLNDFIFCPRSIYFHNLYIQHDESIYKTIYQTKGTNSHKNIDAKKYSSKTDILTSVDIYNEELGIIGKIDIFDKTKGILTERKNKIKRLYDGYIFQLHAQYFCLIEMGFKVNEIRFHSLSDNKIYKIKLPSENEKNELKELIKKIKHFDIEDPNFTQNRKKCKMCIYKELCDYYVEQT